MGKASDGVGIPTAQFIGLAYQVNGESHWNGSTGGSDPTREDDIPIEIRRNLFWYTVSTIPRNDLLEANRLGTRRR
jgi:hypothetical protein